MLTKTVLNKRGIMIGIAIYTSVLTGVIGADIYAGSAPASGSLIGIGLYEQGILSKTRQTLWIDTAGVGNMEGMKIYILSASIEQQSKLCCSMAEGFCQYPYFFVRRRAKLVGCHAFLDVAVHI